ncbi:MAG: Trm112 family protein, partial [Candidatus Brocadiales bacterium]
MRFSTLAGWSVRTMSDNTALNPFLYRLICCPDCRGGLSTIGGPGASSTLYHIGTGLRCGGCQANFPIEDGIPLLFSRKIQQETAHKIYSQQYQEHEREMHERDRPIVGYLNMSSLGRVKYHLLNGPSSLRLRKSARKEEKRFVSLARFIGPTEGLTILDVGARECLLLGLLKGNKVAFDLSPFHLQYGRERGNNCVAGFGERLPFKDNLFDV